jgi:hypothetical protein
MWFFYLQLEFHLGCKERKNVYAVGTVWDITKIVGHNDIISAFGIDISAINAFSAAKNASLEAFCPGFA